MKRMVAGVGAVAAAVVLFGSLSAPAAFAHEAPTGDAAGGSVAAGVSKAPLVVKSYKELKGAMKTSCILKLPVALGADIGNKQNRVGGLKTECSTTLELNGHDLYVDAVDIKKKSKLTVTDSTELKTGGAGLLDSWASKVDFPAIHTTNAELEVSGRAHVVAQGAAGGAGIGGGLKQPGGKVTISGVGARVEAVGGSGSAGIGGGYRGHGGTLIVSGADVTVESLGTGHASGIGGGGYGNGGSVIVSGARANVLAEATDAGAGIGGGNGGDGGSLTVNGGGATVIARASLGAGVGGGSEASGGSVTVARGAALSATSRDGSAIGSGFCNNGCAKADAGRRVIEGDLVIPSGKLRVTPGVSFVVGDGGRLLSASGSKAGSAEITGEGTIVNRGTIAVAKVADGVRVEQNDFTVRFDRSSADAADAEVTVARVLGASFSSALRGFEQAPAGMQWRTARDESGVVVTAETRLAEVVDGDRSVTLYLVREGAGDEAPAERSTDADADVAITDTDANADAGAGSESDTDAANASGSDVEVVAESIQGSGFLGWLRTIGEYFTR